MNHLSNKFNESVNGINLQKSNERQREFLKSFKYFHDKIFKSLIETKNENGILKGKLNEYALYIRKLQHDFSENNEKLKEKIEKINNQYLLYITNIGHKNEISKNYENTKESNYDNEPKIISELNKEIDRVKNINHNLNEKILNKEEVINKLREENSKLVNKLNLLRTNPNLENNSKFYNSFSTMDNSIYPKRLLSNKDSLNNNSYNNLKIINNLKGMDFSQIDNKNESNYINNLKSNNFNKKNFVNFQIEIQSNFSYFSNNHLIEKKHMLEEN